MLYTDSDGKIAVIEPTEKDKLNPFPVQLDGDYAVRFIENSADSNIEYYGKASIGSSDNDPVWQIKKIDNTSGVIITWADGNENFDNIWDNRESLTYE